MEPDENFILKKESFFTRLLGEPSCGSMEILLRDADELGLPCRKAYHRVIVAEVETWGELLNRTQAEYDPDDRAEAFFVISNICAELFSVEGKCDVNFSAFQGRIVFWLDADSMSVSTEELRRKAEYAANTAEAEYQLVATISIGDWFSDLFSAFAAYQDTLNLMFYFRYLSDQGSVYTMENMPMAATLLTLSDRRKWEERFLRVLEDGSFDGVKVLLRQFYEDRFEQGQVTLQVFPQRRASFTELLELTAVELKQRYTMEENRLEEVIGTISTAETAAEQLETMELLLDDIAACVQPEIQEAPPEWVGILTDYVQKNFMDSNITVYNLAHMVHITPSYCTRIFRRHMGVSLLEYVQQQRVQSARSLLERGCTMVQAARQAGFTCTQTMRRTLKRYRAK